MLANISSNPRTLANKLFLKHFCDDEDDFRETVSHDWDDESQHSNFF
jgi:hypothetical protein